MQYRLIFSSRGEALAFIDESGVFSMEGTWAGFIVGESSIYDVRGDYVGLLLNDGRVAIDTSRPLPPPVPPPRPKPASGVPNSIPHRAPMPALPKPFREAILMVQDTATRPVSFIAAQVALVSLVLVGVGLLMWQFLTSGPGGRLGASVLDRISVGILSAIALAGILAASTGILVRRERQKDQILLVGTKGARKSARLALSEFSVATLMTIVESDFEAPADGPPNPELLRAIRESTAKFVVLADFALRRSDPLNSPVSQIESSLSFDPRLTDVPTLVERVCGQLMPDAETTRAYFHNPIRALGVIRPLTQRVFDILVAWLLLSLSAPVILVAAVLIRLESRGPVLYRQERVGMRGRPFYIAKFRTMRADTERDLGPTWAASFDRRVTRVGRILRRLRIDELPQLINVLQGEMSIVGPRPERPLFVEQLTAQLPGYNWRHLVKPGITGWAQVRYQYGATIEDASQKLAYDLYYVKNRTLFLDIVILLETVGAVLSPRQSR